MLKRQLSFEELEMVSGGNREELALDTQLFNTMGGRSKAYVLDDLTDANVKGVAAKIDNLWSQYGIMVQYNDTGASQYFIDGNPTTRNQAVKEVIDRAGYLDAINPAQFQLF